MKEITHNVSVSPFDKPHQTLSSSNATCMYLRVSGYHAQNSRIPKFAIDCIR